MSVTKSTKTIQQFIDELTAIKQEHGDVPVFLNNGEDGVLPPKLTPVIMKEHYSGGGWYVILPKVVQKGCLISM